MRLGWRSPTLRLEAHNLKLKLKRCRPHSLCRVVNLATSTLQLQTRQRDAQQQQQRRAKRQTLHPLFIQNPARWTAAVNDHPAHGCHRDNQLLADLRASNYLPLRSCLPFKTSRLYQSKMAHPCRLTNVDSHQCLAR